MTFTYYIDVYPWNTPASQPYIVSPPSSEKPRGATRYRIDVTVPDPAQPDAVADVAVTEVEV